MHLQQVHLTCDNLHCCHRDNQFTAQITSSWWYRQQYSSSSQINDQHLFTISLLYDISWTSSHENVLPLFAHVFFTPNSMQKATINVQKKVYKITNIS